MDRRRALLAAGAAASAAFQATSSGPLLLPRSTRAGIAFVASTPAGFSSMAPRRVLAALAARSTLTYMPAGVRMLSTCRRHNKETFRFYMLQMSEHLKGIISKNHSAAMLKIERNRADLYADLQKSFHEKIWRWLGAVFALCSASISVSYFLNDHRVATCEDNVSKRMEGQRREIKLLWLEHDKQKESLTVKNEVLFYMVRGDEVTKDSHVVINDSPCRVHTIEQHAVGKDKMIKFACRDMFTCQHMELMLPYNCLVKVPYVTVEEYLLVHTNSHGLLYVTISREETGEKKDIRAPPAMIATLSASEGKKVFVTVTSALGKDVITSVREVPEAPSLWAWASGFFKRE